MKFDDMVVPCVFCYAQLLDPVILILGSSIASFLFLVNLSTPPNLVKLFLYCFSLLHLESLDLYCIIPVTPTEETYLLVHSVVTYSTVLKD